MRQILPPALLLLLAFPVMPLLGQQAAPGPACVVFPVSDLSHGTDTKDYEQTITEAVSAAFTAAGFRVLPGSGWQDAAAARSVDVAKPMPAGDAISIARSVGADIAITGLYSVQGEEIYYSIQCWNALTGKLAAALQADTPFNLAFFSGLNIALASDLIPRLAPEAPAAPRIVFRSPDEGMRVKLSDDQDIGRITDGRLTMPEASIPPGTKVLLAKSKPGFHPAEQTVAVTAGGEIPLKPLVPEHHHAMELNFTLGQLLGMGAALRDYRVPDWFFLSVGSYVWVQPPLNFSPRALLHIDISGGIGGYLFLPPDAPVRLGISTGGGLILSFFSEPGLPPAADFYLDLLNLWVEAGFPGTTFYLRQEYRYALGTGGGLLGQGMMIQGFPPTTLGVLFKW